MKKYEISNVTKKFVAFPCDWLRCIYTFTDLLFSLQSTQKSKLYNYEFLAYFANVKVIYSFHGVSFHVVYG